MAKRRVQALKTMGETESVEALIPLFRALPDPRSGRNQLYPLEEVLFVALAGFLSGFNHLTHREEFAVDKLKWFRTMLPYEKGIPSHDTVGRVLGMLCPDALEKTFEQ